MTSGHPLIFLRYYLQLLTDAENQPRTRRTEKNNKCSKWWRRVKLKKMSCHPEFTRDLKKSQNSELIIVKNAFYFTLFGYFALHLFKHFAFIITN